MWKEIHLGRYRMRVRTFRHAYLCYNYGTSCTLFLNIVMRDKRGTTTDRYSSREFFAMVKRGSVIRVNDDLD